MTKIIRLTISFFLFAGWAAAHERYQPLDTTNFASHPETYEGQLVAVKADVIAISADSKSLELFDGQSRMIITVKLTQLSKAQRSLDAQPCTPPRGLRTGDHQWGRLC